MSSSVVEDQPVKGCPPLVANRSVATAGTLVAIGTTHRAKADAVRPAEPLVIELEQH